ncbi:MAG: tRNA (adenosine(37)-N6)-dimethylallyltransferase MiaA [Ectothiorhodospiraceae bacterium]|nr:tRNA (adenosine(37)-N6)-dimethylallyltransferase MiaA [Chromatiales bacterium]MCP5157118.1 tRNA (adenosine(37)-N6)-dimethylallyltransferase MiaA [Ectothiorhodospiraceae bacterium]
MSAAPVVFLMGPTASGKTDAAVAVVERLPVDIVSVDSAMVYRRLDIGTGKPEPAVLARAPHRLIDVREPFEAYSAAEFARDARREIAAILAAGRVPLLVGGTGLYFRALRRGLAELPAADESIRAALAAEAATIGWAAMHARLAMVDPATAARVHPNDPQRIQRALEVHAVTGEPMSALLARGRDNALPWPVLALAMVPTDREWLHRRIARRFDHMLELGLVEEVVALRGDARVTRDLPAMRAVGYRQVWEHLDGECDAPAMRARAVHATRQLAKRQLTWLRGEPDLACVPCDGADAVARILARVADVVASRSRR